MFCVHALESALVLSGRLIFVNRCDFLDQLEADTVRKDVISKQVPAAYHVAQLSKKFLLAGFKLENRYTGKTVTSDCLLYR